MIQFEQAVCGNLASASSREWIETNGLGGFASSTIIGLNTRRYHGLLVAALKPPVERFVLLSKLEDTIVIDGRRFELSSNQYPGVIHPQGYRFLKQFRLDPFPVFTYAADGLEIEKSVFMIHDENSTVIQYALRVDGFKPGTRETLSSSRLHLEVRPLIAFRNHHNTTHENDGLNPDLHADPFSVSIQPYEGLPKLHLANNALKLIAAGHWYRNFQYDRERERGLDFTEDLFNPFVLIFDLENRAKASIIASTETHNIDQADEYRRAEIARRDSVRASCSFARSILSDRTGAAGQLLSSLVAAADQYIVRRQDQKTAIAGYHWFTDWGRDTMIALPGLTLVTGRAEIAKTILKEFARYLDRGMLPNRFPDLDGTPEYNTVDATLWFFDAIRALLHYTNEYEFVKRNLYEGLKDIIAWHLQGTRYGIRVDRDGLLTAGEESTQLTWMDAKRGSWIVTPRNGKPVEVQALWYNALMIMAQLADKFGDQTYARRCSDGASLAHQSFNHLFWNESGKCLYDVIDGNRFDRAVRPNQIFAVSLHHSMLSLERSKRVVEVVERDLLTPFGLRSLAPSDPQYHGRYDGDPARRDGAYHQGTVWAWLMGPFITAYVKVNGRARKVRERVSQWLPNFHAHLSEAGLGQVSEIFDGDAPHLPRGCIAQAWSVAELMRAIAEDVMGSTRGSGQKNSKSQAPNPK